MKLPTLKLYSKNLYGTIRYFPIDDISKAICTIKGSITLQMSDMLTLSKVGFTVLVDDKIIESE